MQPKVITQLTVGHEFKYRLFNKSKRKKWISYWKTALGDIIESVDSISRDGPDTPYILCDTLNISEQLTW